ncbi:B12-binding domain-containing radical SAM protein [Candidatus Auribacterota bacterium]
MKILIAYPPLESDKGVALLSQNRQFQWFNNPTYIYPMVPSCAATLLRSKGYDVTWKDGIAEKVSKDGFISFYKEIKPDLIALETKAPVVYEHWKIIEDLKKALPECKVALFGDHVTAMPEESFKNSKVDYILTGGNYDFLLLSLCDHLSKGAKLETGIWYRDNGGITSTGKFKLDHDLNSLPLIDRDLTKWELYSQENGNYSRLPGTYTMAARDCWYHKCTFCSWTTIYPEYKSRSPQSLLEEVGILINKYGVKEIMDDSGSFPIGPWLKEFCEGMIERGYHKKVILDCNMRFGALSFDEYKLMKKAGFRFVLFGLESANQKTLDRVKKGGLTKEKIIESCRLASKAGLSPHITIMFGYPWEDYSDILETVKLGKYLMKKGYAKTLQSTIVIPYPGTPLFDECKANGWLNTMDWSRYDMREPIMKTPLPDKQLKDAVQSVYKVAFDPEFIFRKLISIRNLEDVKFIARAAKAVLGHLMDFGGKKCNCETNS